MRELMTSTLFGVLIAVLICGLMAFGFVTYENMTARKRQMKDRINRRISAARDPLHRVGHKLWQPCVGCCGDDCDWDKQICGMPKRRDA